MKKTKKNVGQSGNRQGDLTGGGEEGLKRFFGVENKKSGGVSNVGAKGS